MIKEAYKNGHNTAFEKLALRNAAILGGLGAGLGTGAGLGASLMHDDMSMLEGGLRGGLIGTGAGLGARFLPPMVTTTFKPELVRTMQSARKAGNEVDLREAAKQLKKLTNRSGIGGALLGGFATHGLLDTLTPGPEPKIKTVIKKIKSETPKPKIAPVAKPRPKPRPKPKPKPVSKKISTPKTISKTVVDKTNYAKPMKPTGPLFVSRKKPDFKNVYDERW